MKKKKVLFVCIHNAGRSQIAEELLRQLAGDRFEVESAGFEPGKLNPIVVETLKEEIRSRIKEWLQRHPK